MKEGQITIRHKNALRKTGEKAEVKEGQITIRCENDLIKTVEKAEVKEGQEVIKKQQDEQHQVMEEIPQIPQMLRLEKT